MNGSKGERNNCQEGCEEDNVPDDILADRSELHKYGIFLTEHSNGIVSMERIKSEIKEECVKHDNSHTSQGMNEAKQEIVNEKEIKDEDMTQKSDPTNNMPTVVLLSQSDDGTISLEELLDDYYDQNGFMKKGDQFLSISSDHNEIENKGQMFTTTTQLVNNGEFDGVNKVKKEQSDFYDSIPSIKGSREHHSAAHLNIKGNAYPANNQDTMDKVKSEIVPSEVRLMRKSPVSSNSEEHDAEKLKADNDLEASDKELSVAKQSQCISTSSEGNQQREDDRIEMADQRTGMQISQSNFDITEKTIRHSQHTLTRKDDKCIKNQRVFKRSSNPKDLKQNTPSKQLPHTKSSLEFHALFWKHQQQKHDINDWVHGNKRVIKPNPKESKGKKRECPRDNVRRYHSENDLLCQSQDTKKQKEVQSRNRKYGSRLDFNNKPSTATGMENIATEERRDEESPNFHTDDNYKPSKYNMSVIGINSKKTKISPNANKHEKRGNRGHVSYDAKEKKQLNVHKPHLSYIDGKRRYKCLKCSRQFKRLHQYCGHMTAHSHKTININPFKCSMCPMAFSTAKNLSKHFIYHKNDKPYMCNVCYMTFTKSKYLDRHKINHERNRPLHKCKVCKKSFSTLQGMTKHYRELHKMKPSNSVSDKQQQTQKMLRKSEQSNIFKCEQCTKSFEFKSKFVTHMKIHTNEKLYECTECLKTFRLKHHLTRHIWAKHSQEKCKICKANFEKHSDLLKHMDTLHKEVSPFKCTVCLKRFKCETNRRNHMRLHTGEKPYKCHVCQQEFTWHNGLGNHMKRYHRQNPSN